MEQQNEDKKWISEMQEWVEDDYEYCEAAAEIVDEYCRELQKEPGMTRIATEDDISDVEVGDTVYTDRAQDLIESEIGKWQIIGAKYWPEGDIDIHQHLTQYRER